MTNDQWMSLGRIEARLDRMQEDINELREWMSDLRNKKGDK